MLDVDVEACARGIFILTRSQEEETQSKEESELALSPIQTQPAPPADRNLASLVSPGRRGFIQFL